MAGVLIGLSDLHYTKVVDGATTPETAFANPIKKLAKAIEAKVTTNVSNALLHADDMVAESTSNEGQSEIELGIDALANAVYAELLGKEVNADGAVGDSTGDIAPNVALAFRAKKTNGKYRYVWYYKGNFQIPDENYKTQGESIEYNTPTIKGVFVHSDVVKNSKGEGMKRYIIDEDDPNVNAAVIANWFTDVYTGPSTETPET